MGKDKIRKFAEFSSFGNTFEYAEHQRGEWHSYFGNPNPITVELACGKAEYTVGMARMFPDQNYIGVDVKGNRIWRGAKTALEEGLNNAAFLRAQIDHIEKYFTPGELSGIWITFADPQPRAARARKRLTHPMFLNRYRLIAQPGAPLFLKTDSQLLYAYSKAVAEHYGLEILEDCEDVYAWAERPAFLNIITHYEQMWLERGKKIKYLVFRLPEHNLNWKHDYPDFPEGDYSSISSES